MFITNCVLLLCRKPCIALLERRAQVTAEVAAFKYLMLHTPAYWISNLIHLRTMVLDLSPAQKIAAHHVLDMVKRKVPRDWSMEALHSFSMWMPMEMQSVIDGVNHMEIENQSEQMVAAETEALLRENTN